MKEIIFFLILISAICCEKNDKNNQNEDKKEGAFIENTCNQLSVPVNYNSDDERFKTVDFGEGKDTFRIVCDTIGNNFKVYLQSKIRKDCWKTLEDVFECRQNGIKLLDLNDDGFIDIHNEWRWWTDVHLYVPEYKSFSERIEIGGLFTKIGKNIQYDYKSYPKSDSSESRLFRFENSDIKIYAKLKIWYRDSLGYIKDDKIELYEVRNNFETHIRTWQIIDLPAFTKNNGDYDYIETEEFVNDFWAKNWNSFVPK